MGAHQSRGNDPTGRWSEGSERSGGRGAGSLLVATLLGVGIGLLAAPQPGTSTRKLLRERLSALGEGMGEGLEEVQGASSRARKRLKRRLAKLREEAGEGRQRVQERWSKSGRELEEDDDEDEESGSYGKLLALAAGLAATYFLTSERTATARGRVQETAADVGRRATDQWDRFQRGGMRAWREGTESRSETRPAPSPSDEAPQAG
jgi:gas vesicle protein